ncbi:hypothetical protein SESBI_48735, partial [Sesbania bispinosa]
MHYEEGEVHAFHNLDLDTWSYFEALGLLKDLGYNTPVKLLWESKGLRGWTQWKEVKDDEDAIEVSVEATVVTKQLTYNNEAAGVTRQGLCNATDGDASDSSEDFMENIYFDDSEEDKDLRLDDGFSDIDEMTGEKNGEQPECSTMMEKHGTRRIKKKEMKTMKHPVHEAAPNDVTPPSQETDKNVERIHDMEEEYISDDLESGDDSDIDGSERP